MEAARRERRHHRKAAAAAVATGAAGVGGGGGGAAAARAAYGDVFGGPPRFAAPFGGAPLDYAEVFGGVAATCSIPYLDLPPAPASSAGAGGFFACRGKGDYGEIFGRFDFADFALPYEDLFGAPQREPEPEAARDTDPEIASSSGSSTRSSFKKESCQLEDEPSILHQHYQNLDHRQHFKDHKFSPISFSPDTESPQFVVSYNKTTERRPDDLIEMTTCTAKPSLDFVIDSRNLSHDTAINHVSRIDNGTMANDDDNKNPSSANTSVRSPESDFAVDQKQQSLSWTPISGSISANENHKNSDIHSTRSTVTPPDYAFLWVSDSDAQTQPIKVQPILRQQPKLLNKKESAAKGCVNIVNHNCSPTSAAHTTSSSNMPHTDKKVDGNPTSASAAMKEAMDFAEARLKAAKALLEGKGDSFKLRKKPSHLRSTRSMEIKSPISVDVDTSEQKLSVKKSSKEEKNLDDSLFDKHKKLSAVRLDHFDDNGKKVLPLEKPQHMLQHCTESCQTSSELEKLGNWKSGNDFFELSGDDQKCKTDEVTEGGDKCKQTDPITSVINDQRETEFNAADSDLDRYEKPWEVNDGRNVGVKHVNLGENKTAPVDKDRVSVILEPSTENMAHQETHNSIGEGLVTLENAKESHDTDKCIELPTSGASTKLDVFKDVSGSLPEACSSVNASDLRDHGNISPNLSPLAGTSQEDTNSKLAPEVSCDSGMQHSSRSNEKLQESSDVSNVAISQGSNIKSLILEELKESDVCDAFTRGPNRIEQEAESYGREKFSFIDGSLLLPSHFHNKGAKINLVSEKVQKFEIEKKVGPCAHPEVTIVDLDADCPKDANDDILQNDNFADPEESNMLNVFEVASKLIKRELDQGMHGSLGHGEEENMEEGMDAFISDINGKEADETALENSECTGTEEGSAHCNLDQNSSESTNRGKNGVDAKRDTTCDEVGSESLSGDEVVIKATSDSAGEVSNRGERELPTERSTCEDHKKAIIMEEKDTTARISKAEHVPSPLETTCGVTKSAEAPTSVPIGTWKKEVHGVQRTKERENMTTADSACEKDKGSSQRVQEKKENERRLEKERELAEEKERRKLEKERELAEEKERTKLEKEKELAEEKERRKLDKDRELAEEKERRKLEEAERERERKKDRLAVERATREAHERAFAEAREKAEKMALERITAARQRASAEAREKEERASVEAAPQRATREARIKAERAAVERATAEARERAIEKAKAEKALAEARERRERYKSSFKESFKSTNQDIRQESQFQRATSGNFIRNPDSGNRAVVEVESALRHKARLERHQRTAERVTKALAEKNMRDLLAQREQAEKHRLSEFLDPEIKRWSNGKEGNLRALLSTLQYILGADSGWQPVPLTDLITAVAVKKAYRKATLCVHPDKLQQRGATIRQKYICEKVFDLLKDAWNKFTSEER
ncbi:auxilin-like protein 1 isoform X1 [Miscanthus floridulus]|uniref:auxilin-like protein 1 isoform X1 n=2 Tax=Miscanthus floridulus TaxID=154761 RepID=UPI0034595077